MNLGFIENQVHTGRGPLAKVSGFLLTGFSLPFVISGMTQSLKMSQCPGWVCISVAISSLIFLLAGLTICKYPKLGRLFGIAGIVSSIVLMYEVLIGSPGISLATSIVAVSLISYLIHITLSQETASSHRSTCEERSMGACYGSLAIFTITLIAGETSSFISATAIIVSSVITYILITTFLLSSAATRSVKWYITFGGIFSSIVISILFREYIVYALSFLQIPMILSLVLFRNSENVDITNEWWAPLIEHPGRLLVGTFGVLCVIGTILLSLPIASASIASIGFLNAAFTSVSAVCVTGLLVLDTPNDFSFFGQIIILVLIQLGGLGIMTFSTAALRALGRRLGIRHETAVASLISHEDRRKLFGATKTIIVLTFGSELIGAAILFTAFIFAGDSIGDGIWRALFTSISAFCNAGFSLQTNSLISYNNNALVLHTVGALIIIGGLSPLAIVAIPKLLSRSHYKVSTQIKIVITTSISLLVVGFFLILTLEWNNTLSGFSFLHRLNNAWFQSITLRTAGFNSIDISQAYPSTLFIMLIYMFVGGSPGGTAGGIKTTTAAIILLVAFNAARGRTVINAFRKQISSRVLNKAIAITTLSGLSFILATLALQITQSISSYEIVFEVISALGTVGLSIGATPQLDGIGKIIIIVCMFVGRVGTLTFFVFLTDRIKSRVLIRPEEDVDVG